MFRPSRVGTMLFLFALAPRLILLFAGPWSEPQRAVTSDSPRYLALGANIERHGSFGLADEEPARAWYGLYELRQENGTQPPRDRHGLYPEAFRTPGYPLAIAASGLLFGDARGVLMLQCLLGAAAAVWVWRLGAALGLSSRAACAAGVAWALLPGLIVRDCQYLTESLFTSLGVLGLYTARCGPKGWKGWLLAGATLGFAGLVRPLGVLYLPAAAAFAARDAARPRLAMIVIAAATILPSVGWIGRNAAVGNGARLSTVGDVTLLFHYAGYTISEDRGVDWLAAWPATTEESLAKLRGRVGPGDDVYKAAQRLAIEELKARPGAAARVLAKSWVKLYVAHSLSDANQLVGTEYRPTNLISRLILREDNPGQPAPPLSGAVLPAVWSGVNFAVALTALVGFAVAVRRGRLAFALPLVATAALFTVATMSQGMERFRTPFEFALLFLAVAPWGLPRAVAPAKV